MGFNGLFRDKGVDIQLEEAVRVVAIVVHFEAPPAPDAGTIFEFMGGCKSARADFETRDQALRFARRLAIALGISGSAYGQGLDAMASEPPPAEVTPSEGTTQP